MFTLTKRLADLAQLEQIRAGQAEDDANRAQGPQRAIKLGDRDRHTARAGAFIEAAKLALESRA
jgi:hypothetical protein